MTGLNELGIGARAYYQRPVHKQPALMEMESSGDLRATDKLAATGIALPMGPALDEGSVREVVDAVANLGRSN